MAEPENNPFPGANPFIEWERYWRDFHRTLINYVREAILKVLPQSYDARIEEDALLIDPDSGQWHRFPDVSVTQTAPSSFPSSSSGVALESSVELEPEPIRADEERQVWIDVVDQNDDALVTSIEILSPTNKLGNGRAEFRFKRKGLFEAGANLVDIDLLLGGRRIPFKKPLPEAEFFGLVSRQSKAPLVQVFPMRIGEPLKSLPIPLREPDGDIILDLQSAYDSAFSRGGYPRRLRYATIPAEVDPTLAAWCRTRLAARPT